MKILDLRPLLTLAALGLTVSTAMADASVAAGEAIYRAGMIGSGAPIEGVRQDNGQNLRGEAAACVHCHRNSGLGSREGAYSIPPVTLRYLYRPRAAHAEQRDLPDLGGAHPDREPYTDTTLARAIREGIDPGGRPLGYLMPRFALSDDDMTSLIAYLKTLTPAQVPGVTPSVLHFATIITPDADPVKRQGMLDVLEHYFAEKNASAWGPGSSGQAGGKVTPLQGLHAVNRHWKLHVWQLAGPPTGWSSQLQRHVAEEPVMAVLSGLGGTDWSPVHRFCQTAHLPCLFPNLEVPVDANRDFYSLYFSKGVLLESQLIAQRIGAAAADHADQPVQQIYRAGDSGEAGAHALASALRQLGRTVDDVVIPAEPGEGALLTALARASGTGPLVLWLRSQDLSALAALAPPQRPLFASGLMGGLEHMPLPEAWRAQLVLAYPFDLPARRVVRTDYPLGWFRIRKIPVVAEQVQVDTFLACGLMTEALNHMADTYVPEYLIERIEDMVDHRILTGYYPRLSLAQGQRFASKGGYLVQWSDAAKGGLAATGGWVVP
jgi:cytochrome c553